MSDQYWRSRGIPTVVIFMALIFTIGYLVNDMSKRAEMATNKVAELTAACETAEVDYAVNWSGARNGWGRLKEWYDIEWSYKLGDLQSPSNMTTEIRSICGGLLFTKQTQLARGEHLADLYSETEVLLRELAGIVAVPAIEYELANSARGQLEGAKYFGYVQVYYQVWVPGEPGPANDLAVTDFTSAEAHLDAGWVHLSNSRWQEAYDEATRAMAYFASAQKYSER